MIAGLGTEIVEIIRIERMIDKYGELFLQRVFTDAEIRDCNRRATRLPHFAARWAGKSAVIRALGVGISNGVGWRNLEIVVTRPGEAMVA